MSSSSMRDPSAPDIRVRDVVEFVPKNSTEVRRGEVTDFDFRVSTRIIVSEVAQPGPPVVRRARRDEILYVVGPEGEALPPESVEPFDVVLVKVPRAPHPHFGKVVKVSPKAVDLVTWSMERPKTYAPYLSDIRRQWRDGEMIACKPWLIDQKPEMLADERTMLTVNLMVEDLHDELVPLPVPAVLPLPTEVLIRVGDELSYEGNGGFNRTGKVVGVFAPSAPGALPAYAVDVRSKSARYESTVRAEKVRWVKRKGLYIALTLEARRRIEGDPEIEALLNGPRAEGA